MENKSSTIFIIIVVAFIVGGLLGYGLRGSKSPGKLAGQRAMVSQENTKKEALRQDMRKLWTDHVVWTRDYIIASVDDKPDAQAAANRLLKNQEDIGNTVAGYYGQAAGDKLTELLKQHILIAVDLVAAAKANNQQQFNELGAKWEQNGQDIADFLSSANPSNWSQADLREMMKMHLATTTNEAVARLRKDYEGDVKAYDAVYNHILVMSDTLSDGIIKQFPDKF